MCQGSPATLPRPCSQAAGRRCWQTPDQSKGSLDSTGASRQTRRLAAKHPSAAPRRAPGTGRCRPQAEPQSRTEAPLQQHAHSSVHTATRSGRNQGASARSRPGTQAGLHRLGCRLHRAGTSQRSSARQASRHSHPPQDDPALRPSANREGGREGAGYQLTQPSQHKRVATPPAAAHTTSTSSYPSNRSFQPLKVQLEMLASVPRQSMMRRLLSPGGS